jgi:hypothetical protein
MERRYDRVEEFVRIPLRDIHRVEFLRILQQKSLTADLIQAASRFRFDSALPWFLRVHEIPGIGLAPIIRSMYRVVVNLNRTVFTSIRVASTALTFPSEGAVAYAFSLTIINQLKRSYPAKSLEADVIYPDYQLPKVRIFLAIAAWKANPGVCLPLTLRDNHVEIMLGSHAGVTFAQPETVRNWIKSDMIHDNRSAFRFCGSARIAWVVRPRIAVRPLTLKIIPPDHVARTYSAFEVNGTAWTLFASGSR